MPYRLLPGALLILLTMTGPAMADPPPVGPVAQPSVDIDRLLEELRQLDSSEDQRGDHVVGEQLC